jgi:probable HAF family extracellular repeat protein
MTAIRPAIHGFFRPHPIVAALIGAFLSTSALAADGFTFLGTLPGDTSSTAYGVSADGAVVVGVSDAMVVDDSGMASSISRAFRWTAGTGMQDLGTLGGTYSQANAVSADGAVVVGESRIAGGNIRAFRWTAGTGMQDLGTLGGANSYAYGVSADGAVVVGESRIAGGAYRAFRWTAGTGMQDLGTLPGDTSSTAYGVSADGAVVVGVSDAVVVDDSGMASSISRAFRWTAGTGMQDLGTLGGTYSRASGVSADGAVVVGGSDLAGDAITHAFRWTGGVMTDLGTLGGTYSQANAVSADGAVVVGKSDIGGEVSRAFRWTQASGMQSVEDWLRAAGVAVASDITKTAYATNADGSVVVGELADHTAFIARVSPMGSGLLSDAAFRESLSATAKGASMALGSSNLAINGAHSRPLMRRVQPGQNAFWLAGDWGRDDHGARDGDLGLAEVGIGRNFGAAQVNVSLGQTWAKQNLPVNGRAKTDGTYLLAEALIPVSGNLWAVLGGYGHWGDADLRRGYLNAGIPDASTGKPGVDTWGVRGRLEWEGAFKLGQTALSPYADLSYSEAKLDAYTETGGGFPAHFNARTDKATELRLGVNAAAPLTGGLRLVGTLEAAHRFEDRGARTTGNLIGLMGFSLDGVANKRDWLRAGAGVEGKLGGGTASLMLNVTTQGEAPSAWLAANWQMAF